MVSESVAEKARKIRVMRGKEKEKRERNTMIDSERSRIGHDEI